MEPFIGTETLIIELLFIASLVAIAVRRLRIPYTVALVVVGLLITFQSPVHINLTPELILALFVPPLVFEAAFHLNINELRRNFLQIFLLAVPGVIVTTLVVGMILSAGTSIPLSITLVFGALIAATDPVAVMALFRTLGVPKRLAVLIEGESLLNDGIAIVIFNLMLVYALTGKFNLINSIGNFLRVSFGGIIVGLLLGWAVSRLIARVDDYLIETTLTTILAFGSYLAAEQLHFSGVLAVLCAGLVNGNIGPQGMSPTTRIVLFNFWEYVAFLTNSLVFLLIGLQVNIPALVSSWQPVAWAVLAVLVARTIIVYGISWMFNRTEEPVPMRWQHVLNWGGLRGAISLALALSLPSNLGSDRELLRVMAYGVVLFALLGQSTTMRFLIKRLNIVNRNPVQIEYQFRQARLIALRNAENHLERRHQDGLISTHAWERLKQELVLQISKTADSVREVLRSEPALEIAELDTAWREVMRAQRSALNQLYRDGIISEEVQEQLAVELDAALQDGRTFDLPSEPPSQNGDSS